MFEGEDGRLFRRAAEEVEQAREAARVAELKSAEAVLVRAFLLVST